MAQYKFNYKKIATSFLIVVFLMLAIFQVVHNIGKEQIKIWDESSSAANSVEMLANKHYIVIHNDGVPQHTVDTRPPFALWLKVLSFKIFGISEFSVRFPTIVAAIFTMLIFMIFGYRYLKRDVFIILSLFLIALTPGYMGYHVARHGDVDTLLIFFVTSYILLFFYILNEFPKVKNIYYILFALSVGVAGLTKSILGFSPLIGIAIFAFTQKKFYQMILNYKIHLTWITALLIFASYYIIREILDPNYINDSIIREIGFANSYPGKVKHPEFIFYFKHLLETGFYPFMYVIPIAIIPLIFSKDKKVKKLIAYSFFGAFFFWLGNSMSVMKNEWYIAPIYPYLWLFISISVAETLLLIKNKIADKKIVYIVLSVLLSVSLIYLYVNRYEKIHTKNQAYDKSIYPPEREGDYIDELPVIAPNEREFLVLTTHHPRQMKFYMKKLNYLDSSYNFTIKKSPKGLTLSGKNIITANPYFKSFIECYYGVEAFNEGRYCNLYKIDVEKKIELRYSVICDVETLPDTSGNRVLGSDSTTSFLAKDIKNEGYNSSKSLLLSKNAPYGFSSTFNFENVSYVELIAWYKGNSAPLLVVSIDDLSFYSQDNYGLKNDGEWHCITSIVKLPEDYNAQNLKVYVWNLKENDIFVDDFNVNFY